MSNLDIIRGRSVVLNLTNQSGSTRTAGDVVVLSAANDESFTVSSTSNYATTHLGVVDESIGIASNGRVVVAGYARNVKVSGTATRGEWLYHSSTSATGIGGSAIGAGAFGQFIKGGTGTTPSAIVFSTAQLAPAGSSVGGLAAAHGVRVYHNTTQTATSGAVTPLVFNTERYDTDAYHSTVSNTGRLTVPSGLGGLYHIGGVFEWAGTNTTGERAIFIRLNGTTDIGGGRFAPVAQQLEHHASCDYNLAVGDYVELIAYQTSTGTRTIESTGNRSPEFWMHFIGTV